MTSTITHRRTLLLEAALCLLAGILFYHPILDRHALQSGGDSANLFWPIRIFIQQAISGDGVVPLWNPWSFMGFPLAASLQHAVYYPPDRVLFALLPAHTALNMSNFLHVGLAGIGAWAWLRVGLLLPRVPATACGALFPCTAWFWGQQEHINRLAAVSWMPWMLLCWWLFLKGRLSPPAFVAALSLITALQFFTGHPQEPVYSHLLSLAIVLGFLIVHPGRKELLLRLLPSGAAAMLLAGLLVSLQLLPTLEMSQHSRRQFRDPSYSLSFSMTPDFLVTYLSPHHFGSFRDGYHVRDAAGEIALDPQGNPIWDRRAFSEYGLYIGIPMLLLALVAVGAVRRRLVWGLVLIAIVALLLALGGNTDPRRLVSGEFSEFPTPGWSLYELFLVVFPIAEGFRVPARLNILTTFSLVTLAAFGFAWVLGMVSRPARPWIAGAIIVAMAAALYVPSRREKFNHPVDVRPTLQLASMGRPDSRTLDHRHFRLTRADDGRIVAERHYETTFAAGNSLFVRMLALQPHFNMIEEVPVVEGYEEGLAPTARFKDFVHEFNRNMRQFRPDADFLALIGVSNVYSDLPVDTDFYPVSRRFSREGRIVYTNPRSRGAAYWAEGAVGIDFARFDGPFWRGGDPHPEIRRDAADYGRLEAWERLDDLPRLTTHLLTPNRIRIVQQGGNRQVDDAVLTMGWFPGWVFSESRNGVAFLSAVHLFLPASEMTAFDDGDEGWEIVYRPNSWRSGLFLTLLGVGLWAGIVGAACHRRRHHRP